MGRKLFVGNLPFQTGETELQDLFARIGQVESVQIMRDMPPGARAGSRSSRWRRRRMPIVRRPS
jgi:RNA recognition motif-containing protein